MANTALDRTYYNTLADDDGSGLTGTSWDKADVDAIYIDIDAAFANASGFGVGGPIFERGRAVAQGEWVPVTYANTNFTASGGVAWDVGSADHVTFQYMLIGKTMFVDVYLDSTSVVGPTAVSLFIAIPGGFLPAVKKQQATTAFDNGTGITAYSRVTVANNKIEVGKSDGTTWTGSTNNTFIRVSMFFEIQ